MPSPISNNGSIPQGWLYVPTNEADDSVRTIQVCSPSNAKFAALYVLVIGILGALAAFLFCKALSCGSEGFSHQCIFVDCLEAMGIGFLASCISGIITLYLALCGRTMVPNSSFLWNEVANL